MQATIGFHACSSAKFLVRCTIMIHFNSSFDSRATFPALSRDAMQFHKRLPSYAATPLVSLPAFANECGIENIFVKDESQRLGMPAFKILGASWATYCVLCRRFPELKDELQTIEELKPRLLDAREKTLYSATDGNHGRAVARTAKMFGLGARIYVPQGTAAARIVAIESEGALVTVVDGTYDDAVGRAANDASVNNGLLIQDNGWEGYEEIPRLVMEGYSTMLWEIDDQLAAIKCELPTHVVVQLGVGTFGETVARHFADKNEPPVIIGVEPETAACVLESVRAGRIVKVPGPHTSIMAGMNCDTPSLVTFPVLQKGIRCFVSISDERAMDAMRLLARHNIVSGETGAAGIGALLELFAPTNASAREALHFDSRSRVLIFSTEGATDPASCDRIVLQNL
jgi:diaminopropionate ammonia-lyase